MKPDRKARFLRRALLLSLLLAGMFTLAWVAGAQDGSPLGKRTPGQVLDSLTAEEREWLRDHPVITLVHDPAWPPIEFSDERGEISGMAGDYVRLVEQRLGVKFTRVRNLSWEEGYARQKRWEIDMATCVAKTPQRTEFWTFTKPYLTIPIVIATQSDVTYIYDIKELFGRNVALVKGYAIDDWITNDFPEIKLTRVKDPKEGLALLQRGEVFAYIDNLLIIGDYQAKMRVTDIKIAGQTPYANAQCMAVRKDWAPLAGILDKALDSIPDTERKEIFGRWLPLRYERGFDYTQLYRALAIFALILLVLTFWNRRLATEVKNRKRVEAALRESEVKYRSIFENAVEGIFQSTPDGRFLSASPSLAQMLGYDSPDDLMESIKDIGKEIFVRREDRARFVEQINQSDVVTGFKQQLRRRDGSIVWVSLSARSVRDERGELVGLDGFVIDITERELAIEALRESEGKYRALIEATDTGYVVIDFEGRVLDANPKYMRFCGYTTLPEILGRKVTEWTAEHDLARNADEIRKCWSQGFVRNLEIDYVDRHGHLTPVEINATVLGIPDEPRIVTLCRDITERKQAEESLRQANLVIENSPVVLFRWRAAEGWPVEMVSRNVSQLGYTPEELLSGAIPFASMVHPEDLDRIAREVQEYTTTGVDRFQQEYRIITRDGVVHWVDDRTQVERDGDGQVTHYQGIVIDITQRKRAEEALRQEKHFTDTLIDSMPGMFYLFDEQAQLARWNKQFEQSTGYDAESISRMSALDFIHPEDQSAVAEKIHEVFVHGESHVEGRVVTKHGGAIPFYLTGLRITIGDKAYLLGVGLDIGERLRAEAESARLQALLRSVILQSPVPMVLVLPDGTVELFNEGCRSVLGVPEGLQLPPDLNLFTLEKTWIDYSAEGVQVPLAELPLTLALQGKTTRGREMKIVRQDGTERWILVDAVPVLDDHGTVIAGFLVFIDITERKRAEEAVRTSQANLQLAFEAARLGDWSWDIVTGDVQCSDRCKALYGTSPDTAMNYERFLERVHPEDRERVDTSLKQALETRGDYDVEKRVVWPDGSLHWNATLGRVFCNTDGRPVRLAGVTLDITERRRAEEALRESMRRLQTVVNGAPIVLYSFDRHGVFTLSEGKGLAGLGIKPGEIVGRTIFEVYGDQPAAIAALHRAMAGETFTLELSFPAGGTFEVSHTAMRDEAGNYNGTIGVLVDITERKRAEVALRESEERYRLLFSSINDAVFVHRHVADGLPGQFIEVNDIACERLGYTRQELLQMSPQDIDTPEMRDLVPSMLKRLSVEGRAVWEGAHVSKAGRRIPVEISNRMFELGDETVVLSAVRDISERKDAEDENRRLRNYLANIIDSMPSVLVGVDMNGRVTQWNAAAQQRTGISAEEANGQPVDLVLPALSGELDKVKEAVWSRIVKIENRVPQMADGEMRYQDVTVYPLVSNGLEGAVIRVDDVTERVQIEEMMIQSEKMLSVGGLAAGMAHEINNPLGAILQASQNIVRRVSPELPVNLRVAEACGTTLDTVRKYLEQREILSFLEDIRNSGLRAAQIVENVLAFSRKPEAGGSSTDLAELLDRTLVLAGSDYDLKKRYDFRQIEIIRDYAPDTPPVICQAGKMQQVFFNILRNGAEAMREVLDSGHVPRFILRVLPEESMVQVEIEDSGPGMDEVTRKRIFEPFFTTKPPGSGTGLGLSISYFIVTEDHGGTLSVDSQPGTGTRFVVRLPIAGRE